MPERASETRPERKRPAQPIKAEQAPQPSRASSPPWLLALQHLAGNAAVAQLLADRKAQHGPVRAGVSGFAMGSEPVQVLYAGRATDGRVAVQRVTHKTGAQVDAYASASPFLKTYVKSKITAGTKVEGHVHIHDAAEFKTVCVAYYMSRSNAATGARYTKAEAEAVEPNTNAFRDGSEIHLHTGRGEAGTAIHEGMHLYSDDAFKATVGMTANEGTTELFARIIYAENSITRGAYYESELASVRKLVAVSSRDKLADGYFKGNLAALKADAETKGAGTWNKWVGFMKARRFSDADALF